MCGIAGIFGEENKATLKRMLKILRHRGPDDSGFFSDGGIAMGMTRLSIIDLEGGHQPMHNEDGTAWIVFNGEIFNYRKLRKVLESKGHRFYTNSDTEVIVHAYEEYGAGCVKKLRGMFAFAIWDCGKRSLFLARDRIGICPLYYAPTADGLVFASEIKAILEHGGVKRKVDCSSLNDYLIFQAAVGPDTLFEGIKELPPAHTMSCDSTGISLKRYWDLADYAVDRRLPEAAFVKKLGNMLEDSVSSHLVSDVPVGIYLSGGVDSGAVLGLMKRFYGEKIDTFSVGFGYGKTDELPLAREMAEFAGADHHEVIIEPEDLVRDADRIVWHMEDPIADFGEFSNFYLSRELNAKGIKVSLSGGGGDELFGGYWKHYKNFMGVRYLKRFAGGALSCLGSAASSLYPMWMPKSVGVKMHLDYLSGEPYKGNGTLFPVRGERQELYSPRFLASSERTQHGLETAKKIYANPNISKNKVLTRMQYLDMSIYIDAHMLHQDKMNLAHSVELRYPLLDHELAEFAFSIPENLRVKRGFEKYIFRKAIEKNGLVPKETLNRRKKGFISPIEIWLSGDMRSFAQDAIERSGLIRRTMRLEYIRRLFGRTSDHWYAHKVWGLMVLALWHSAYFER